MRFAVGQMSFLICGNENAQQLGSTVVKWIEQPRLDREVCSSNLAYSILSFVDRENVRQGKWTANARKTRQWTTKA